MSDMRNLLICMLNGMAIRENSYYQSDVDDSGNYLIGEVDAMIQACTAAGKGDQAEREGYLLHLFSYWSNDIQSTAAHYGIQLRKNEDGKLYVDDTVPEAPSADAYWDFARQVWVIDQREGTAKPDAP